MSERILGFIGLGNMGRPMAKNIRAKGHRRIVFDVAGTADRAPEGSEIAQSVGEVARRADVLALSLPTVAINRAVVEEIAAGLADSGGAGKVIVDACTIGQEAAAGNAAILTAAGVTYLDAPVSGLPMRAESASLSTMVAGPSAAVAKARPLIEGYSANIFHVGETAGLGQRMKVVNNALYIASLVVISEGLAFGERGGLTLDDMLAVINTSSGQSFGTQNVFPQHIANGSFDGTGAEAHIIKKDLGLFVDGAAAEGSPGATIAEAYRAIAAFSDAEPTQDKARIYPFVRDELTPDIQG